MLELISEVAIALLLSTLTVGLVRRRRLVQPRHHGFDLLLVGLCLVSMAAILDAVNAEHLFPGVPWWSSVEAMVELFAGFVLGIVFIGAGLWRWVPALIRHQQDMAARLEAEERLRKEEQRYRQVVDAMPGIYFMYDRAGHLLDWNATARVLTGRSDEEMAGVEIADLVHPDHRARVQETFRRAFEGGEGSVETDIVHRDGTVASYLAVARVIRLGEEDRLVGLAINISDRKRIEEDLARHASLERLLLGVSTRMINIPIAEIDHAIEETLGEISRFAGVDGGHVFLRSAAGDTVSLSHSWHNDRLGYDRDVLQHLELATAPWTVRSFIENHQPVVVPWVDDLPEEARIERQLNRAAGVEAYVSVPLLYRDSVIGSLGFDAVDGPREWSDTEVSLLQIVGQIITNALQRKRADEHLQQLNLELEERVRRRTLELEGVNQELESFAYSVSHDLRAPLRAIVGFSQALLEDQAERLDGSGRDYLGRVVGAGQRLGDMIDGLLTLSQATRAELRLDRVDLATLAESVIADLRAANPDREVEVCLGEALTTRGDPRLLGLVVQNLLDNAWKFSAGRHPAHIEVGLAEVAAQPPSDGQTERAFFVRDNGAGFEMAYADKLFGPFQRLHRRNEFPGTGIGLATVQRIVHRHGGRVWAEAEPGIGATFFFTIGEAHG